MKTGRPRIPPGSFFLLLLLAPPGAGAPLDPCQFPVPEGLAARLPANRYQCAMSDFLDTKCQETAADAANDLAPVGDLRCESDRNCVKFGEGLYFTFLADGTGRVSRTDTINNTNTPATSCELLFPPVDCAGLKELWKDRPAGAARVAARPEPLAQPDAAAAAASVVVSAQFQGRTAVPAQRPASASVEPFSGGGVNSGDISDVDRTYESLHTGARKIRAMTREAAPRLNDNASRPDAPDPVRAP